ncbi:MAG: hypothetical protein GX434_12630 [Peptococcaceae bacterium]|nr:hypothetical protein [Peptococcaceae bacterium]
MFTKKGIGSIIGWAMLTILAIFFSITRFIRHDPYYITLTIAVLMFLVLVYLLILRRIDGPSSKYELDDEHKYKV